MEKTVLTSVGILAAGVLLAVLIFSTEPTATQTAATKQTPMLVNVTEVSAGTFNPSVHATGTVVPARELNLSTRVSGEVQWYNPDFIPGKTIKKGTPLVALDSTDYIQTLKQQVSELRQAEAELTRELGRQEAAKREYELYGDTLSEANKALVLRQPQLATARAEVEAARAAVDQAQLNVDRTTIRAPFDAHILNRNVNEGSQVAAGESLGRLVAIDEYWVEATVPLSKIKWFRFQEEDGQASEVRIRNTTSWSEGQYRTGLLVAMPGALEEETRMARVIIKVEDPLGYYQSTDIPKLVIGEFVEVDIKATPLEEVVRINRDYLRQNNTVWVMENRQLQIRKVDIVYSGKNYAYIRNGLEDGQQVVTTNLANVSEGAPLQVEQDSAPENDGES